MTRYVIAVRNFFRNLYWRFLCLEIVYHPPLGRLGVWLCDRYEYCRYRTRIEDNLVVHHPPLSAGPFDVGGVFNIEYTTDVLPPARYRVPKSWFSLRSNSASLLERLNAMSESNRPDDGNRFMLNGWLVTRKMGNGNDRFFGFYELPNSLNIFLCWSAYPPDGTGHWSLHSCWPGDCRPYYDVSNLDLRPQPGQYIPSYKSTGKELKQCADECLARLKSLILKVGPPPFDVDKYRIAGDPPQDLDVAEYRKHEDDLAQRDKLEGRL